ncbi:MerR family DNA-binding protein [Beggiatoa alba]|nr:MerR family DNA-binding protein [Beggiatoa alba]
MTVKTLTIGRLARAAGVNIETIRYYQRVKLIIEPVKPQTGYRQYSLDMVERLQFIKRAQKLGFSLKEISELLEMGDGHCSDIRRRAEEKRRMINKQIEDLSTLRNTLDKLIHSCNNSSQTHCPIVKALSN